jgi:hypothetical protein
VTEDDCEQLALEAHRESGLDDRPFADPCVMAVSWAGLRLRPEPHGRPHIADGVIVYPASASPPAVAYFVAHELGHDLLRWAGAKLDAGAEERAASRIGSALMLPRRGFLRDLHATGGDLGALRLLWPLATPWVLARRATEVLPASAAVFAASGRCLRRVGAAALSLDDAREVDGSLVALRF